MPTASNELRRIWHNVVSKNVPYAGDHLAMTHLERKGWRLKKDWTWITPHATYVPTAADISAIMYLIQEWDFGGIAT